MPIGLMNLLLRAGKGAGRFLGVGKEAAKRAGREPRGIKWDYDKVEGWKRPLWQRPTPVGGGVSRGPGGKFVGGARKQPGWINRMYMNPTTTTGTVARLGGLGVGGAVGADRLAAMMRGEGEDAAPDDVKAMRSAVLPSDPGMSRPSDFETRQAFEARKAKKMNKQMFRLLQYYGMVNLVNPDSASDMLKLGTAMLEQEIGQMGTDRQAKIFDAIFKDDKMPASGAEAAKMILNAGGTVEDVQDITGIYESITPKAPSKPTKAEMQWELTNQIYAALQVGDMEQAKQLAIRGIASGMIPNIEGAHGMGLSLEDQATRLIEGLKGVKSGSYNTSLAQGVAKIKPRG